MKLESINKKIDRQKDKVAALKEKYDEIAKKYAEAERELKGLLKAQKKEQDKERVAMLTAACKSNNIEFNTVTEIIESGKLTTLLEAMKEMEQEKEQKIKEEVIRE